jgi:hypothetical protein
MGGVRAPQAPFRLVATQEIPKIVPPVIVEKVVEVEKIVPDPSLQAEIGALRLLLKAEGEKCALLSQSLAQKPDPITKIVEKIVLQDKPIFVDREKIVSRETIVRKSLISDRVGQVAIFAAAALGFLLGVIV